MTTTALPRAHRRFSMRLVRTSLAFAAALPAASWADFGIGTPGLRVVGTCSFTVDVDRPDCAGEFTETLLQPQANAMLMDNGSDSVARNGIINASVTQGAAVRQGALGARAVASASSRSGDSASPHVVAIASSSSSARWVDSLTARPPGVALGTQATLLLNLPLSGFLSLGPTGIALPVDVNSDFFSASLRVSVRSWNTALPQAGNTRNAFGTAELRYQRPQGSTSSFTGPLFSGLSSLPAELTVAVPIRVGTPFWLDLELRSAAAVDVSAPSLSRDDPRYAFPRTGSAASDYLSTLGWNVPTLVLAGGTVVTSPGLTSLSGTNYNVPILTAVPEPGTLALWALGLGLLALQAARRPAVAVA
ncbi:MAG: PEP-CTERM sorting domain-containing protein [Gemmatimonas sp.]